MTQCYKFYTTPNCCKYILNSYILNLIVDFSDYSVIQKPTSLAIIMKWTLHSNTQ